MLDGLSEAYGEIQSERLAKERAERLAEATIDEMQMECDVIGSAYVQTKDTSSPSLDTVLFTVADAPSTEDMTREVMPLYTPGSKPDPEPESAALEEYVKLAA
jgi:hypothetical protein